MTGLLEDIVGPDLAWPLAWVLTAVIVLGLLYIFWLIARRLGGGTFVAGGRSRKPRLAVLDATAVDTRRRLILVRRDDVEHLILIGGPTDVVVERGIPADGPADEDARMAPRDPVAEPRSRLASPAVSEQPPRQIHPRADREPEDAEPVERVRMSREAAASVAPPIQPTRAPAPAPERSAPISRPMPIRPEAQRPEGQRVATMPAPRPIAAAQPAAPEVSPRREPATAVAFARPAPPIQRQEPVAPEGETRREPVAPAVFAGLAAASSGFSVRPDPVSAEPIVEIDDAAFAPPKVEPQDDLDTALMQELEFSLDPAGAESRKDAENRGVDEEMAELLGDLTRERR